MSRFAIWELPTPGPEKPRIPRIPAQFRREIFLIGTHTGLQHSLPRIGHTKPVSGDGGTTYTSSGTRRTLLQDHQIG